MKSKVIRQFISEINTDGYICEGINEYTPRPKHPIFHNTTTSATTTNRNQLVEWNGQNKVSKRPGCESTPSYQDNNQIQIPYRHNHPHTTVTNRCPPASRPMTEYRNCGWKLARDRVACLPGQRTRLTINRTSTTYFDPIANVTVQYNPTIIVRVCESSRVLGVSVRCVYVDALGHGLVPPSELGTVWFTCPQPRDLVETGGWFSVLVAKYAAFEVLRYPVPNVTVTVN
jgi:hypothetical protein